MDGFEGRWRKQRIVRRSSDKRIERVENGVDERQTEGIEVMEDGVKGRQARVNEKIDGIESRQAKVSEKMEDGGERRQARGVETK